MSDLIGTLQAADSVSAGGAAEASEISKGREGASESNHPGFGGAAAKDDEARDLDAPAPKLNLAMSHFDVVDELGDGSFSEVLHVVRRETGARYALKVMHKRHILREKKAAFVKNERAAMDACRRVPGVVRLHFTFQDCNSLYLGMELCAGGELFDQIRRRKPRGLPVRAVRFYAAELLDILQGERARCPTSYLTRRRWAARRASERLVSPPVRVRPPSDPPEVEADRESSDGMTEPTSTRRSYAQACTRREWCIAT